jgi:hypothetical protein|tara:strand:- start:1302 stop:1799 length:498 start_codon:yes stop_codon:yes gene_type:complete
MPGKSNPQTFISFGSGVRLMEESEYIQAMGCGITTKGFRALCANLRVPVIFIGEGVYVDMHRFEMAMAAVTRIGNENFLFPGSAPMSYRKDLKARVNLEPDEILQNYETLATELIAAKKVNGVEMTRQVRESARKAAERMRDAAIHQAPWKAQQGKSYERTDQNA